MSALATRHDLLRGRLRTQVPLARHTTWRTGGPAECFYEPADLDDLCAFLHQLPVGEHVFFLGLGSNLLVRDGGIRGTVIHLRESLTGLSRVAIGNFPELAGRIPQGDALIYAEAGAASPRLARFVASEGLTGAEFLAGIPGTLGGALAMNAGCHGSEIWGAVAQVLTIDRQGRLHTRTADEFEIGYRHVATTDGRQEWFVAAWLHFSPGDGAATRAGMRRMLERRAATQPLQMPNAGSVFRNPPGDHAARLIESCGLKGLTLGQARVSEKHANFIVNLGGACAADIEALIVQVRDAVKARTGIDLIPEVRIVGEPT